MKEKKQINIEIGLRINQSREAAGLTQETFSELIGLGVKHVSAIECGAVGVSLTTLKNICNVLSVSSDALLFGLSDNMEQFEHAHDLQILFSRLSLLPPNKFKVAKDILDKVFEAFAIN